MEEILHRLKCIKSVHNGIFTISTGAGFLSINSMFVSGQISIQVPVGETKHTMKP